MIRDDKFDNIGAFDIAASEIFAALYDAFPIRINLSCAPEGMDETRDIVLRTPDVPAQLHSVIHRRELEWNRVVVDDLCDKGRLDGEGTDHADIAAFYSAMDSVKESAASARLRCGEIERLAVIKTETADWLCKMGYISVEGETVKTVSAHVRWAYDKRPPLEHWEYVEAGYTPIEFSALQNARLTSKGLEALRAVPASLIGTDEEASLGEQLKDELGQAGSEFRKQSVSKIVGAIIGHAVGTMTGVSG